MNWTPSLRRPETLTEHLRRLADQLVDLANEVRASVAGLTGEAIGRAVRDILLRFWKRSVPPPAWNDAVEGWSNDPWDRRAAFEAQSAQVSAPTANATSTTAAKLALALQSGVWLLKYGSVLGAAGVGVTVGGLLLFRNTLGLTGIDLASAVVEIASLIGLLASAPPQLILN